MLQRILVVETMIVLRQFKIRQEHFLEKAKFSLEDQSKKFVAQMSIDRTEEWTVRFWSHVETHRHLKAKFPPRKFEKRLEEILDKINIQYKILANELRVWLQEGDADFMAALVEAAAHMLNLINSFGWSYNSEEVKKIIRELEEEQENSLGERLVAKEEEVWKTSMKIQSSFTTVIISAFFNVNFEVYIQGAVQS